MVVNYCPLGMATARICDSRSGFCGFLGRFGWWPKISDSRLTRSTILSLFRSSSDCSRTLLGDSVWWVMVSCSFGADVGSSEMRGYFLASFCLPPLYQNTSSFLRYFRGCLWNSCKVSCRFSTRRRLVHASYLLIFLWKYRRKSSFFFSTPVVKKGTEILFKWDCQSQTGVTEPQKR